MQLWSAILAHMMNIYIVYLLYFSINVFHCLYANLLMVFIAIWCNETPLNSSLNWAVCEAKNAGIYLLSSLLSVVVLIWHHSLHSWEDVHCQRKVEWTSKPVFQQQENRNKCCGAVELSGTEKHFYKQNHSSLAIRIFPYEKLKTCQRVHALSLHWKWA